MHKRRITAVGAALVAAGALMVAVGAVIDSASEQMVLAVLGSGLVAAGLTVIIRVAPLTGVQPMVIGVTLILAGTVIAVLADSGVLSPTATSVTPIGGAFVVAGLIEVVLGSTERAPTPGPRR